MTTPAKPLSSKRILIVDDQPSIRGVLEVALLEAGADVWSAEDGKSALEIAEATRPDLILLDLAMPGMSGWQVLESLRASPQTATIPVVLQTSSEDFASFDRAKKLGVAAFLSKPFRLNEVVETCRRIFIGARPLQGTPVHAEERMSAQVRDRTGNLLTVGLVLDVDARGALLDLDTPLSVGQWVVVTVAAGDGSLVREGHVRWISREGSRYHHGMSLGEAS